MYVSSKSFLCLAHHPPAGDRLASRHRRTDAARPLSARIGDARIMKSPRFMAASAVQRPRRPPGFLISAMMCELLLELAGWIQ